MGNTEQDGDIMKTQAFSLRFYHFAWFFIALSGAGLSHPAAHADGLFPFPSRGQDDVATQQAFHDIASTAGKLNHQLLAAQKTSHDVGTDIRNANGPIKQAWRDLMKSGAESKAVRTAQSAQ
jgi:hypothetical protein